MKRRKSPDSGDDDGYRFRSTQNAYGESSAMQNNSSGSGQHAHFVTGTQNIRYETRSRDIEGEFKQDQDRIIKNLNKIPYREAKDRNSEPTEGTCQWFINHERFMTWRHSPSSSFLWVSAEPGCGKSVLARYLADTILRDENSTICYYFIKDDFEGQTSLENALKSILHQLFTKQRYLLTEDIIALFDNGTGYTSGSVKDLWEILISALFSRQKTQSHTRQTGLQLETRELPHSIICVIDALDEADTASDFATCMCKLFSSDTRLESPSNFHLKFIVTSRPYPSIRRLFQPILKGIGNTIHLDGDGDDEKDMIQDEVSIYIDSKIIELDEHFSLSEDSKSCLSKALKRTAHRTYLWAYLTLDLIRSELEDNDEADIGQITKSLPPNLDDAYDRLLSRSKNRAKAMRLLQIIVAATRPLSLEEMNIALSIRPEHTANGLSDTSPTSDNRLPTFREEWFRDHLKNLCGLFVTVIKSEVYLIHQSAKEFLITTTPNTHQTDMGEPKWKASILPRLAHTTLFHACAWYLTLDEFQEPRFDYFAASDSKFYPHLYAYAARNWLHHFKESHIQEDVETLVKLVQQSSEIDGHLPPWFHLNSGFRENSLYYNNLEFEDNTQDGKRLPGSVGLVVATYCGLVKTVDTLLQDPNTYSLSTGNMAFGMSLRIAALEGHSDMVVRLLRCLFQEDPYGHYFESTKAVLDGKDSNGDTALCLAVQKEHVHVVRLLIEAGSDPNLSNDSPYVYLRYSETSYTPLKLAASNGYKDVLEVIFGSRKWDGDRLSEMYYTALESAAQEAQFGCVDWLLKRGANARGECLFPFPLKFSWRMESYHDENYAGYTGPEFIALVHKC